MNRKKKIRKILAALSPQDEAKLLAANLADDLKEIEKKIVPQKDYSWAIKDLRLEMIGRILELPDYTEIKNLRAEFENKLASLETENIEPIQSQMQDIVSNDITTDENLRDDLEERIKKLRLEFLSRLNNLGGGSQNQRIQINGTTMSAKYADINLVGTGITVADNNTTKQVDITIPDSAAAVGGTITGGTAGSLLFINPTSVLAQDNANLFWNDTENRLGLSTTEPNTPLHLDNQSNVGPQITLSAPSGGTPGIAFRPYQTPAQWSNPAQALISATDANYSADIHFWTKNPGAVGNALVERMVILYTGEVGLGGSTSPTATLSLGTTLGRKFLLYDTGPSGIQAGLGVDMGEGGRELSIFNSTSNGITGFTTFGTRLESNGAFTELVRIQSNGNMGNGVTGPTAVIHLKAGTATANTAPLKLTTGTNLTTPEVGAVEYDANNFYLTKNTALRESILGVMFTQTATQTVSNVGETTLFGSGVGTLTLPANTLVAGKTIRIMGAGVFSTQAVPGNVTIKIYLGTTVVATGVITNILALAANNAFDFLAEITCRTTGGSGTVMTNGKAEYDTGVLVQGVLALNNAGATTTVDTTASQAISVKLTWATQAAANTISTTTASVEILN